MKVAGLYILFALISAAANIGFQHLTVTVYPGPYPIPASMAVGTAAGLMVKYCLDARFIFKFKARDHVHTGKSFGLYGVMGVLTTLIFWAVEWTFNAVFHTAAMRYLGACLGLAIGYALKYRLDKRFTFREAA